ncbi:unnamed protein product [Adineta steineri]|uniref:UBC core domain-containing protein n=1 Tax=Adineta steineri TaxID=433720 RepID=A0A815LH19_9BILA|nr:unnamed protein product [Adineta steineri]
MSGPKLNKALYNNITRLKLCNTPDAPVKFIVDQQPFDNDDDDDNMSGDAAKATEYLVIGRILPDSDIYKERAYQIEMKLTRTFPLDPPDVRFLTPIYHPNVAKDGKFCHELLKKTCQWTPATSLVDVVKAVVHQIDHPDLDYSSSYELGRQYKEDPAEFKRKATEYVTKHGLSRV